MEDRNSIIVTYDMREEGARVIDSLYDSADAEYLAKAVYIAMENIRRVSQNPIYMKKLGISPKQGVPK